MNQQRHLTEAEAERVELGEALGTDYFYLPVIYYSEPSPNGEEYWHSLRYDNEQPPASLLMYASKVPAGLTLWQAVRRDLQTNFQYPHEKSFVIEQAKPYDIATTKDGVELTRLLVWVEVDIKFNTTNINPAGVHPFWHDEGEFPFNLIVEKYFQ